MGRSKIEVFWITFTPWSSSGWDGSRHFHLLRNLPNINVTLFAWDFFRLHTQAESFSREIPSEVKLTKSWVLPRYWKFWRKSYPKAVDLWLNKWLLSFQLYFKLRRFKPDIIVLSSTHYATGFLSIPRNIPILFDHVDEMPEEVGKLYFEIADSVAAASSKLMERAMGNQSNVRLIENGVDADRYSPTLRESAKSSLGLNNKVVVSLIGLTCSPSLYFLDSFALFSKEIPNAVLLLVGNCTFKESLRKYQCDIRPVGHIPYDNVANYFNATDIGIYPCDNTAYYREAYPLKIVEYTAAGCQVVTSPVEAFASGWDNIHTSEANSDSFYKKLIYALRNPGVAPSVHSLSWKAKSEVFRSLLLETYEQHRARSQSLNASDV